MTGSLKLILLVFACLLLAGFVISALLVSSAHKEKQKRNARMAAAVSPHLRAHRLEVSAFRILRTRDRGSDSHLRMRASSLYWNQNVA